VSELVQVTIDHRDDVVIARVTGELDIAVSSDTERSIGDAVPTTARALVVDFSELDFIDSSGVAMLFGLARRLGSRRQGLHLVAPKQGTVGRVLDIVGFERAAPIHDDLEQAIAAI
jgi:anti-anti-sigma factor